MLKFLDLNSIRSRMVSGFLFLTLLIVILSFVSLFMLDRTGRIAGIHGTISQLEVFTLSLIRSDQEFFSVEMINEEYYRTRQSAFLHRRDSLLQRVRTAVNEVKTRSKGKSYSVDSKFISIDSTLSLYNATFASLEALYFEKGFKDFGLEGVMRTNAHKLEERNSGIPVSKILYLRRNEKDFFLRHDMQYPVVFNTLADALVTELSKNPAHNKESLHQLHEYRRVFNQVVDIQQRIGLNGVTGLRNMLNQQSNTLTNQYFSLAEYSYNLSTSAQHDARIFYIIMLAGAFLFSILSGYWISKRLSEPIARLSQLMNSSLSSRAPGKNIDFSMNNAAREINVLTSSFVRLMDQTNEQMKEISAKSKLLKKRNRELKKLNHELDSFLYSTAHDLRAPLSSLLGLIDIADHENKQPEIRIYFDMMENSIHRMESFIAQIVDYSKNKRVDIIPAEIDLGQLISEIFENHRYIDGAQDVEPRVAVNLASPFFGDLGRTTILFNNLISNAIRYSDPEKKQSLIEINIDVTHDRCTIEFRDNGIGIEPEHIDKIFNMFYRANVDSKGSGLGLFIFKETIEKMNGDMSVTSIPGQETSFLIGLPNLYSQVAVKKQKSASS